jgi:hypothetical protein
MKRGARVAPGPRPKVYCPFHKDRQSCGTFTNLCDDCYMTKDLNSPAKLRFTLSDLTNIEEALESTAFSYRVSDGRYGQSWRESKVMGLEATLEKVREKIRLQLQDKGLVP